MLLCIFLLKTVSGLNNHHFWPPDLKAIIIQNYKSCQLISPPWSYSLHLQVGMECVMVNSVNHTGSSGAPYLVKCYFWVCLWGCIQKSLAFELMDWTKQMILLNVGGHHSISLQSEQNKNVEVILTLPVGHLSSPVLSAPDSEESDY